LVPPNTPRKAPSTKETPAIEQTRRATNIPGRSASWDGLNDASEGLVAAPQDTPGRSDGNPWKEPRIRPSKAAKLIYERVPLTSLRES